MSDDFDKYLRIGEYDVVDLRLADTLQHQDTQNMTRSELIQKLAITFPQLTIKDAELAVKVILDQTSNVLAQKGRVEIRGFGSFSINQRPPRKGRNPKSGETVMVPAKDVPHFKAGKELRERVDSDR